MSPEDRLSTQTVISDWLSPDERDRALDEDFEAGPLALNNVTLGLQYQVWHLTWSAGDFTVTPETVGAPQVVLSAPNVTQCSLAFDNNAHINISYTSNDLPYLYWYDTLAAGWVTTQLAAGTFSPVIMMDDKRATQTNVNDIILHYTRQQPDDSYNLYRRLQRERFLTEKLLLVGALPYLYKVGMNKGLRVQIGMLDYIL